MFSWSINHEVSKSGVRLAFNRWMRAEHAASFATRLGVFLLLFVGGRAWRSWVEENFDFRVLHAFGESIHGGRASVLLSSFAISYSSLSVCFGTHLLRVTSDITNVNGLLSFHLYFWHRGHGDINAGCIPIFLTVPSLLSGDCVLHYFVILASTSVRPDGWCGLHE